MDFIVNTLERAVTVSVDVILPFLIVLTILVFVHEMGHFWVARRNGVRVDVFSIGFGPELFGWNDRHGTRWKFSAVPLGGYVKMFGEYDAEDGGEDGEPRPEMTPEEQAVSFHHKKLRQRTAIVAAGPIANFIFAIVMFAVLFTLVGNPRPLAGVGRVVEDSAAAEAGFQTGDTILAIDGQAVHWFADLRAIVSASPGKPLAFDVKRGDDLLVLTAVPKPKEETGPDGTVVTIGQLGVGVDSNQIGYEKQDPLTAIQQGVERTWGMTTQILDFLGGLTQGRGSADDLGGPIQIAKISGEMFSAGWVEFFFFMAALSVNLGLINLFPVPMLDGGHLMFYAAEAVRGKPLSARAQEYGFRFGLVLVLLLMVFVTWNDLMRIELIKNLVN
ncbi:MAG: RIP metalloprotease RseP [Rhodobacterales bacterium]|nr:RIP metalloprotease RseP [Rhodobacterales bacterium]